MLYEYCIVTEPTDSQKDEGALEELLVPVTLVIAKDQKSAEMQAVAANADAIKDNKNAKVLMRPFV